jgi:hypothetical protein
MLALGLVRSSLRLLAVALVCTAVIGAPSPARAEDAPERNIMMQYGLGVGSVLCSLVYGPTKVVYATLGSLTGGLAFLLTGGRTDVSREIIQPAIRGDYIVTPEHLTFNQPLEFVGHEGALDKTASNDSDW